MADEGHRPVSHQPLEEATAQAGAPPAPVAPASISAARQNLLYQVLRAVGGQFDPDAVMRLAVRAIDEFSGWEHICLAARDAAGTHWEIRAAGGALAGQVGAAYRLSQGVIGRVFTTGQALLLHSADANRDYEPGHAALRSELAVPIRHGERVTYVLNLESERPDAFDAEDVLTAELLADAIALALDNARLYTEARHELAKRQRVEEALREHAAEVEARNEELDAFAHTVAHDLKDPNAQVIGYAELLLHELGAELPPEVVRQDLQAIARGARKVNNIIEELLLLAEVRQTDVERRPLNMAAIVAEARQRLQEAITGAGAEIHLSENWPAALGHAPWIEEVWVNYLSNALKYGGRPPRVELGATPDGDMVRFWVRDNGPGLTSQAQVQLFTPFTQLAQGRTRRRGLGLSIVRRIVEKLGGQVAVASGDAGGCVFSFTLPAAQESV